MKPTKLLYLEDMQKLECTAVVQSVEQSQGDGKTIVYLDQTLFYPQGGGQPYDNGTIASKDTKFVVDEVRFIDGRVLHIGRFEGKPFNRAEEVSCIVQKERRNLNTRLHSGGHVLDMAVGELGYDWIPGKGYHFPDGPYVEYEGSLGEQNKEEVAERLTNKITEILSRDISTEIRFMPKEEMSKYCRHVPKYLPEGKPSRIVLYGDFGVPCGGTHVAQLSDVGHEIVRKIKNKPDLVRISYDIL